MHQTNDFIQRRQTTTTIDWVANGTSAFEALLSLNTQRKGQLVFHQRKDHKAPVQKTQSKNTALNFTATISCSMTNLNHG